MFYTGCQIKLMSRSVTHKTEYFLNENAHIYIYIYTKIQYAHEQAHIYTPKYGILMWWTCSYIPKYIVLVHLFSAYLKVIPQFCIAHFYCAHLIWLIISSIIRIPFKKIILWQFYVTSKRLWLHSCRITLKSMFSKKAYKSVAIGFCVCSRFIYLYFTF
jgi:hypothetical protein